MIIEEPIGWKEDQKEFARHNKYHGIMVKFSAGLTFIEKGAEFIKTIYDVYGVNAELRIIKEERHPITNVWEAQYSGYLDFRSYKWYNLKTEIKINWEQLQSLIKSGISDEFEVDRKNIVISFVIGLAALAF
ncbi:hypothetical protein N9M92_02400 [Flavobacteriaceae bacterium]|nr:hypothetical protein [Flavobacteriaceae bacterium]